MEINRPRRDFGMILEIEDKTHRRIYLTEERWNHIKKGHPNVKKENIKEVIINPLKIIEFIDKKVFYYTYFKNRESIAKYLKVIVKYLNGKGFIITAYFVRNM